MTNQCHKCGKLLSNLSSLRRHAQNVHRDIADEIAPKRYKNAANYNFNCKCGKNFSDKNNFTKHQKIHLETSLATDSKAHRQNKKCPICADDSFSSKNDIVKHFKDDHEIVTRSRTIEFNTENEFYKWKSEMERNTNTSFIKAHEKHSQEHVTHYFDCNRSGNYKPKMKDVERKRHLKTQGSYKMNAYCPASVKLIIKKQNNTCIVEYMETHVGHDMDPGYINLLKCDRKKIAEKISRKIPFDEILNDVRDVTESEVSRINILRRKDLYNIEQSFNLSSSAVRHSNDAVSVDSWVKEMQEEKHCVLFYKPQGSIAEEESYLKEDDFVLIIMTTAQKEFLIKYGSDIICLDGTHGLNSYNFEVTTLLVLDDLREGLPCSFLISNRSDKEVLKLMFSRIKKEIQSIITPKAFMSDMADSFYNAWIDVMGAPEKRLFCTWHVLRAWRNNLMKIKSKEKQNEVYKQLQSILRETDEKALKRMLINFRSHCKDPDVADFSNYFEMHYLKNIENWAYAYRLHVGINTNMHLERFHKSLKYIYLKGKNVKRLDKGICAIMQFVRDKLFDRLISRYKGKICSKVKEIRIRHKNMSDLDKDLLIECEKGWEFPSKTSQEIYLIQKRDSNCKKCQLKCTGCNICIHEFICSCVDSAIKFNMCKHIHLVATSRTQENGTQNVETKIGIAVDEDRDRTLYITTDEEAEEKIWILNEVRNKNAMKRSIEKRKEDMQNKIARHLKDINSPTKLKIIENILAPLSPTLAAVDSSRSESSFQSTSASSSGVPSNKNIVCQRSLFSTKKKVHKKKDNFTRPTTHDALNLLYS